MARRRYSIDENKIERFRKEGRGFGRLADYKPWLTIQDVPSIGRVHRLVGLKTGRIHHLLSDIERDVFYLFDWQDAVCDIREQFPLDREATLRIAERLGVRHPCDPASRSPIVMTTDLLVDVTNRGKVTSVARSVKPADELDKPRVLEKLEIERLYWAEQGVEWGIVTKNDIPAMLVTNIGWCHSFADVSHLAQPYAGYFDEKAILIIREIKENPKLPLQRFCTDIDTRLALNLGTAFLLVRHLLASRQLFCDMNRLIDDTRTMENFVFMDRFTTRDSA